MTINFDMDGTIANLYGVDNWLDKLIAEDSTPYAEARPLVHMATFARLLNRLQKRGYQLAIISWLSKSGSTEYNSEVTKVKREWLKKHLPSVHWDAIHIVEYGYSKNNFLSNPYDILFDDEVKNRNEWEGTSYDVHNLLETLKIL